jgi:uncharacterized membrane protein
MNSVREAEFSAVVRPWSVLYKTYHAEYMVGWLKHNGCHYVLVSAICIIIAVIIIITVTLVFNVPLWSSALRNFKSTGAAGSGSYNAPGGRRHDQPERPS